MNAIEAELTICLASPLPARERAAARVAELLGRVDSRNYAARLDERRLLTLLGSRAAELAPAAVDDFLRGCVADAVRLNRMRALALDAALRAVVDALDSSDIPALPLKGVTLGERLYGDIGLRPTTDVDVLVPRAQVGAAVQVLEALGYGTPEDPPWKHGLPPIHYKLEGREPGVPRVELHWRVHWSERGLSDEILDASSVATDGLRRAQPAHELAVLLLILARDGLHGPRLAVDLATWWTTSGRSRHPGRSRTLRAVTRRCAARSSQA